MQQLHAGAQHLRVSEIDKFSGGQQLRFSHGSKPMQQMQQVKNVQQESDAQSSASIGGFNPKSKIANPKSKIPSTINLRADPD